MPGVFGIVSSSPVGGLFDLSVSMAAPMRHHDWYAAEQFIDETAGIVLGRVTPGCINAVKQPATNEDETLVAIMEGEIYDYAAHRSALQSKSHNFATLSHAELLLHGFEQYGPAFFRGLHSKFAAAIWDSKVRKLYLVNDRFGMKPLYYAHIDGRLVFGSEIKSLLIDTSVSRQINLRGLAQFFTFGQLLGEDTLFEGVKLLPAAGLLEYDACTDRVSIDRYWRLQSKVSAQRSTVESLNRIDNAFAASVNRMTADNNGLGLSLSGGLDARTILGAIDDPKPVTTLCLGMSGSMDQQSATEMARLVGCSHHQVLLDAKFLTNFESHLRNMVRLTDGQYLCQCIVMPTLPKYRELGVRVLLRGHAGELMHMMKAYNFSLDGQALQLRNQASLFDWLWRHLQSYMLDGTDGGLFVPRLQVSIEEQARESLADCVQRTAGTEPVPHRIWQIFMEQRSRRETALSLTEFDSVVETRLPYLDNEVIEELFSVPPQLKLDDTIQAHILRRRRPEFLKVVNVNTGTHLGANRLTQFLAHSRMRVCSKLGMRGYQPYERLGLWLRQELRPLVQKLILSDRCLDRGIFNPDAMKTVVANHMQKKKNHTYLLLALMVFEVAQQEFVDCANVSTEMAVAV